MKSKWSERRYHHMCREHLGSVSYTPLLLSVVKVGERAVAASLRGITQVTVTGTRRKNEGEEWMKITVDLVDPGLLYSFRYYNIKTSCKTKLRRFRNVSVVRVLRRK